MEGKVVPCQTQLFDQTEVALSSKSSNKMASEFASAFLTIPAAQEPVKENSAKQKIDLDSIFPTRQEETKITKARQILGDIVRDLSDEELGAHLAKFEFLLDTWLDTFEKQIFNDKTLNQLLREG